MRDRIVGHAPGPVDHDDRVDRLAAGVDRCGDHVDHAGLRECSEALGVCCVVGDRVDPEDGRVHRSRDDQFVRDVAVFRIRNSRTGVDIGRADGDRGRIESEHGDHRALVFRRSVGAAGHDGDGGSRGCTRRGAGPGSARTLHRGLSRSGRLGGLIVDSHGAGHACRSRSRRGISGALCGSICACSHQGGVEAAQDIRECGKGRCPACGGGAHSIVNHDVVRGRCEDMLRGGPIGMGNIHDHISVCGRRLKHRRLEDERDQHHPHEKHARSAE